MPYGLKRYQQAETLHFITFSCYERKPYLTNSATNEVVEEILERTRSRHDARIYAYVLMPEHVHLLMNEPPNILVAMFLKSFKQEVSRKLKGERKQFWQTRYFDRNIRGEESMSEIIRYIHRNPVARGWYRIRKRFGGRVTASTLPGLRAWCRLSRSGWLR